MHAAHQKVQTFMFFFSVMCWQIFKISRKQFLWSKLQNSKHIDVRAYFIVIKGNKLVLQRSECSLPFIDLCSSLCCTLSLRKKETQKPHTWWRKQRLSHIISISAPDGLGFSAGSAASRHELWGMHLPALLCTFAIPGFWVVCTCFGFSLYSQSCYLSTGVWLVLCEGLARFHS